jgi:hypothetical protein
MDSNAIVVTPCPTCGKPATVEPDLAGYGYFAACDDCYDGAPDAHCPIGHGRDAADAIEAWNDSVELRS